ncbi:exported hypothetical protein [Capnocytophaga canimorsus]|uniref:Uncharacterized protein n=1 Tax=Capnocytophaga canimorsus TaxID=28188 RepID=A0A0B7I6I6_9FLAO|nr:exported hypothetical protein [Capnocytophaga canimorsus]
MGLKIKKMMRRLLFLLLNLIVCGFSFAQEKKVTGVVKDETGVPLPGVTILVQGEKATGTQTDFRRKLLH